MGKKVIIGRKAKTHVNTAGVTVGTTPAAISVNDWELDAGVQIVADADNAGIVYVGARTTLTAGTDNANDGFPLSAGEGLFLPVAKESDIIAIADTAGQGIHFVSF